MSARLSVGYAPELVDHEKRGRRVQTACGLVEQQNLRLVHTLHGDDQSSLFAAGYAAFADDANRRVRRSLEVELVDRPVNDGGNSRRARRRLVQLARR
jgi:hypothetical protein